MTERERYIQNINTVYNSLPQTELLAQFAEECVEAAHAALKLRRVLDGSNPTEVSKKQAEGNLVEEYADLTLCWELLDVQCNFDWDRTDEEAQIMYRKAARWRRRLEERSKA